MQISGMADLAGNGHYSCGRFDRVIGMTICIVAQQANKLLHRFCDRGTRISLYLQLANRAADERRRIMLLSILVIFP
jgi:hypothetical protein